MRILQGLIQSGAWAIFEDFNRIDFDVLSVVAQQMVIIQRAIIKNATKFMFEDTMLKLDVTSNIFVTINPGYSGESLKRLAAGRDLTFHFQIEDIFQAI